MIRLALEAQRNHALKVLCLGAHCDDIPIGCGGTLLHLASTMKDLEVCWVVFSSNDLRMKEELDAAESFLKGVPVKQVIVKAWRDGFLPQHAAEVKECFEELKPLFAPDLILTHYRDDRHQDHRLISDLTWNTYRNHLVLEYEIPKYDGDMGSPNVFVPLDEEECEGKIDRISSSYVSQREKHWFSGDIFNGLARLRGMEAGGGSKYAEAFYARKLILA